MFKRLFALVAVVLVVALVAPALPVRAQEGGFPVPAACTAEEQTQLTDLVLDIGLKFADAGNSVSPEGPDEYAALALAMNEVKAYLDGDEVEIPFCTDAFISVSAMEFLIDNFIISMQLSTIYFKATEAGDTEFANNLMDYGTFHIEMLTKYQEQYSTVVDAVTAELAMVEEWFPACTDADTSNEIYTQLLALEDATDEQAEALSAFLTDGTVSNDLLLFMEDVLKQWEPLSDDMPMCSEIVWRELFTGTLYYDITVAVGWGAMAPYTEGDLNTQVVAARDDAAETLVSDIEDWEAMFGEEVAAE